MILAHIFFVVLFFLPGTALCFVLFPALDLVKRCAYSMLLAISVSGIVALLLYFLHIFSVAAVLAGLLIITLLCIAFLFRQGKRGIIFSTYYNNDIWYIASCSVIGTFFKLWFFKSIQHFNNPYLFAFHFVGRTVPNLGFYTGMAADRTGYVGLSVVKATQIIFLGENPLVQYFLITFLFLSLIYIVCREYRPDDRRPAYLAVALMALSPVELFYSLVSLSGYSLSYIIVLPFFLMFTSPKDKKEEKTEEKTQKNIFWVSFLLAIVMMFTYYTASVIVILASASFIAALIVKKYIHKLHWRDVRSKIFRFAVIAALVALYLLANSTLRTYSFQRVFDAPNISILTSNLSTIAGHNSIYSDPTFLGLSAIRWQMIFFFCSGLTFLAYLFMLMRRKKFKRFSDLRHLSEKDIDLLLCCIPVAVISLLFLFVNLPARIFDYFAFFGLLVLVFPTAKEEKNGTEKRNKKIEKSYAIFFTCACIFIILTTFQIAADKRVFLTISPGEIQGATWAAENLHGEIFSDLVFVNQLIGHGYYDVSGDYDNSLEVHDLLYQNDPAVFIQAIAQLKEEGVNYIAITKRMDTGYVLMVNYPQKAIFDDALFEKYLHPAFKNSDVTMYDL